MSDHPAGFLCLSDAIAGKPAPTGSVFAADQCGSGLARDEARISASLLGGVFAMHLLQQRILVFSNPPSSGFFSGQLSQLWEPACWRLRSVSQQTCRM